MATQTNRFFRATPLSSESRPFVLPSRELAVALDLQQQRYDAGEELADRLQSLAVNALPEQVARKNELLKGISEKVDATIGEFDGNYAKGYRSLKALEREVEKLTGAGGELYTIDDNYKRWVAADTEARKKIGTKDGPTAEDYRLSTMMARSKFGKLPDVDPDTGAFKTIEFPIIAPYADLGPQSFDLAEKMSKNPKIMETVGFELTAGGKYILKTKERTEKLPAELIAETISQTMLSDARNVEYARQFLSLRGIAPTPEAITSLIYEAAVPAAIAFQKDNVITDRDLSPEVYKLEQVRAANDRALAKYKLDLTKEEASSVKWRLSKFISTGTNERYGTNVLTGNAFIEGAPLFDLLKDVTLGGDIRDPNHRYYNKPAIKAAREELEKQGVDPSKYSKREYTMMLTKTADDMQSAAAKGRVLEAMFGNETAIEMSQEVFRHRAFMDAGMIKVSPDGKVGPMRAGWQQVEEDDLDPDLVAKEGYVIGYTGPIGNLPNGFIVTLPGAEDGSTYIIPDYNETTNKIYEPLRDFGTIYSTQVDKVEGLNLIGLLGNAFGADRGPMTAIKDDKLNVHLYNVDGQLVPLSPTQLYELALRKNFNLGQIGATKGLDNKQLDLMN